MPRKTPTPSRAKPKAQSQTAKGQVSDEPARETPPGACGPPLPGCQDDEGGPPKSVDPVQRLRVRFSKSDVVPFFVEFDQVALFRAFENNIRYNVKQEGWTNEPAPADTLRRLFCGDDSVLGGYRPSSTSAAAFLAMDHFLTMGDSLADEFRRLFMTAAASGAKARSVGANQGDSRTATYWFARSDMKKARDVAVLDLPAAAARSRLPKPSGASQKNDYVAINAAVDDAAEKARADGKDAPVEEALTFMEDTDGRRADTFRQYRKYRKTPRKKRNKRR